MGDDRVRSLETLTSAASSPGVHDSIWRQIVVDKSDPVSPYRQIANAIRHRIATHRLNPGSELPSVRALAEQVGVNPATVARAYRQLQVDGLVETRLGVGTVVSDTRHLVFNARRVSQEEVERAVDAALTPLLQMGYDPGDLKRAVEKRLGAAYRSELAVVITEGHRTQRKYVRIMREELNPLGVEVQGVLLQDLAAPNDATLRLLKSSTRVLTSLGLLRRVEEALARHRLAPPISVIFTELSLGTIEKLSSIPPGARTLIVSEERYRNSVLGILLQHIAKEDVEVLHVLEPAELQKSLEHCQVVVHSLSMTDLVHEHVGPRHEVILMDYQVRPDAMAKLRESFLAPVSVT